MNGATGKCVHPTLADDKTVREDGHPALEEVLSKKQIPCGNDKQEKTNKKRGA
jgi:hypothetical protein